MATLSDWERVREKPLGSGGQSTVYLVRRPERRIARDKSFEAIKRWASQDLREQEWALEYARATMNIAREEYASELGALKVFNPRAGGLEAEQQALGRMKNEIAVLNQKRPGMLKLLDSNESENCIVTEYCPRGTLADHLMDYKGNAKRALTSFYSLVKTVMDLHKETIVHRDIKPQNIFMGDGDELLLGDFGIVFLPNQPDRLSVTNESVGPRDFMPPWVLRNDQPGEIKPSFDVYMLGKVLWCMVAGRLKLHREDFLDPQFNVVNLWPNDPYMHAVNTILGKCVVDREEKCLPSAQDLYLIVGAYVEMLERGGQPLTPGVPRPCRVCGVGFYVPEGFVRTSPRLNPNETGLRFWSDGNTGTLPVRVLVCDTCGHLELFSGGS
jgi:serine/threonine protein kinase